MAIQPETGVGNGASGGPRWDEVFTPSDLAATIYHCLGIEPRTEVHDQSGRPFFISSGNPIADIIG